MTNELKRYYSDLRDKNYRLWQKRVAECETKEPRFRALREEPGRVMQQAGMGKLSYAAAISRISQIEAERKNLLISMGLPSNYLDRIYTCSLCHDTGEAVQTGKLCSCALKKQQEMLLSASRINSLETFMNFKESVYPNDEQKKQALNLKRYCERFIAELPNPKRPNLFIVGQSGLGKSFFGNAIAYAAIDNGIRTVKVTAYQCIQDILSGLDTREEAIRQFLTAELLILDDLGTEAMVPNITIETVFRILNDRIASRLPTVVITNLSIEEIQMRYDERISSRLTDTSITAIATLRGDNLRTRIR